MIELKNVNKYFNHHKKNEIHVINNTSLILENSSLVALLGPSGCGKTTLLNTIGGLDKIKSGKIIINGMKISSRNSYKVDKIRNLNIGYIFQDYKLIDDKTVYDNVALPLIMIGLKDKKEIKKRVEYVLDKVGMLRFAKRPAGMLSGGERQRVGIARAIVKNPNIILADEPTGNLDSKNSLEIMKIIKAISKEKLVILVTHEQSLAHFYASRIIELKDGNIINDYKNNNAEELDYMVDNHFYLKDFKEQTQIEDIKIYSDKKEKLPLKIVVKGDTIYIESDKRVEVVDENSSITFVDDNYKKINKKDIENYNFDFKKEINDNFKKCYSSIFSFIDLIKSGFTKVFDFPILKKILLIGFVLSGMFIMYGISSIAATLNVKEEDFLNKNSNYLIAKIKKNNIENYLEFEQMEDINYLLPGDSIIDLPIKYNNYYQSFNVGDTLTGSLSSIKMISEEDLIYGSMPNNINEIVVDKKTISNMFLNNTAKMVGIINIQDLIGYEVSINNIGNLKIVGIVDLKHPSIYTDESLFINLLANTEEKLNKNIFDFSLFLDKIELKKGNLPTEDYEVIINIKNQDTYKLGKTIDVEVNGTKLKVVGYYFSADNYDYYLVNNNVVKYELIDNKENLTIYAKNKEKVEDSFRDENINILDSYEQSKKEYINDRKEQTKSSLIFSSVILLISFIEIFLMIRSSFLSRIKEIGIYRAIGVKKSDIYKMFISEILAITTITSVPGVLFMAYCLKNISNISYFSKVFLITPIIVFMAIICIYLFNFIVGLLPVLSLIRKRPANILSRNDLE